MSWIYTALYTFNIIVVIYFFLINTGYLLINIFAFLDIRNYLNDLKSNHFKDLFNTNFFYPVTIIVPAYNEEKTIIDTVHSLLAINYKLFELIIISDGSNDRTIEVLKAVFHIEKSDRKIHSLIKTKDIRDVYISKKLNITVIDKDQGGKSDAINAGLNASKYPLVTVIDADSILEQDALLKATYPFHMDSRVVAVGGIIRLANGCDIENGELKGIDIPNSHLERFQLVEYLRSFLFGRSGWNYFNSMLVISGAFGVFNKQLILDLGGYDTTTVGEDIEIILRIHNEMNQRKEPYKIMFIPDPVCWTEAPQDMKTLSQQRNRWQRGLMESLFKYRHMLFNKSYGFLGRFAFPFNFFLEMYSPVLEFLGYISVLLAFLLGVLNLKFAIIFLSVAVMFGVVLSLTTVILEELSFRRFPKIKHLLILILYGFLENLGYRQLHSYWRFKGFIDYYKKNKSWGDMVRSGFTHLRSKSFQ